MKTLFFFLLVITNAVAQHGDKTTMTLVENINKNIDKGVVEKDIKLLQKLYADDFVFTHGTGMVDGKESWLKNLQRTDMNYISRQHDSTKVELHDNVAIVRGKLSIQRQEKDKLIKYGIWYLRIFALRNKQWQMISHFTTKEWHDN